MTDEISKENSTEIDLWGNEVYVLKRTKGRPPFERTKENALKVSMLLAMGWTNDRIAKNILDPRTGKPISTPTLKRHFRSELAVRDEARDLLRSRQLMLAFAAAEAGNVGAMRLFDQLVDKNDMMQAEMRLGKSAQDDTPKQPKKGKKEISEDEAQDAEAALELELMNEANAARPN